MGSKNKKKGHSKTAPVSAPVVASRQMSIVNKYSSWFAVGLMLLLLFVFFYPVLFSGKTLMPPDTTSARSFKTFVNDAARDGTYPLWNPYIYGGMPSFASLTNAPRIDVINEINKLLVSPFGDPSTNFGRLLLNFLIFGSLVYLLLRSKKISPGVACFASLAAVFLPQMIAYSSFGHNSKLGAVALIPVIFLATERLLNRRNLMFFGIAGLTIGLQLLRNHVQICYYTLIMVGVYFLYWLVITIKDEKKVAPILKGFGLLVGAIIMGVLISSVINLSVWEYSQYSIRGGSTSGGLGFSYATNWSFPPAEIITFFIPSFMGFGSSTYWGSMPFTDFPVYFGLITLFLAGLALIVNRNRITRFFAIFAGFALFMSFGKYLPVLYGPMFKILPFFNKFRAPKMVNIMIGFSLVILAGYGLQGLISGTESHKEEIVKKVKKYCIWFGSFIGLLFLFLLLGKDLYLGWATKAGSQAVKAYELAVSDGFRALLLTGFAVLLTVISVKKMNPRFKTLLPFAFILLLLFDLWPVSRRFTEFRPRAEEKAYFNETPEVTYLKNQKGPFRILPIGDRRNANWYGYYRIQNILGYQTARLSLIENTIKKFLWPGYNIPFMYMKGSGGRPTGWVNPREITLKQRAAHDAFMQILNVKYIVSPNNLSALDTSLITVFPNRTPNYVFEYKKALPRAFFVDSVLTVKDDAAILNYINAGLLDPQKTAIIEETPPYKITGSSENKAVITDYTIHGINITVSTKTNSLLVLSEVYYPAGWNAYVDGEKTKIYKTDYVIRSVFLTPGEHKVEFKFEPEMFRIGLIVSLISFGLLISAIVGGFILYRKKNKANAHELAL